MKTTTEIKSRTKTIVSKALRSRELESRERQLRRKVRKFDLVLKKCFARDPNHPAFGTYGLSDANNNAVLNDGMTAFGMSLDQILAYADASIAQAKL